MYQVRLGRLFALGAAVFAASVTGASAQSPNWEGYYIGARVGIAANGLTYERTTDIPPQVYDFSRTTGTLGIYGGGDMLVAPRIVGGAELSFDSIMATFDPFIDGIGGEIASADFGFGVSGRLGYLLTPNSLVFGTLGLAGQSLTVPVGFDETDHATVLGAQLGVGAETFVSDNLSVRVDARYFHPFQTFTDADLEAFDPRHFTVTAGLSYHFDSESGGPTDAPRPVVNWTGVTLSVALGYGAGEMERYTDTPGATDGPWWAESPSLGASLGYDYRLDDDFVVGVAGSAEFTSLVFYDPDQDSPFTDATTEFGSVTAIIALTGRVGYLVDESTLVYGKAGLAALLTHASPDFFALDGGDGEWLPGVQFGGGIETAIAENLTLSLEGTYTQAMDALVTTNLQSDQIELTPGVLAARMGLHYRPL